MCKLTQVSDKSFTKAEVPLITFKVHAGHSDVVVKEPGPGFGIGWQNVRHNQRAV